MKTEKEKMISGELYDGLDCELISEIHERQDLVWAYNQLPPSQEAERQRAIRQLLGKTGERFKVLTPFRCDYGWNIEIGEDFFSNFNLTILDEAKVTIGAHAFIAPNVSIYTACHPVDPIERNRMKQFARPVTIGDNVWIGGSVTILPGVTIGDNVTIGAGSVVVHDIPSNTVAVGNPCRVVKEI